MKFGLGAAMLEAFSLIAMALISRSYDPLMAQHMTVMGSLALVGLVFAVWKVGQSDETDYAVAHVWPNQPETAPLWFSDKYADEVIRYGVIATVFWGIVGSLMGVLATAQMA